MENTKQNQDELQRRKLQEYIFSLEEIQERAEDLSMEHEQLKRTQDLLNAIVDATTHGICLVKKHEIVWYNKGLVDIFGWKNDELTGKTTRIFCPDPEKYEQMNAYISNRSGSSPVLTFEFDFTHKDGFLIPCLVSYRPLDSRDISRGYIFSFTDILKRKLAEEKLKKAYGELEELVKERTKDLHDINEQLNRELAERKQAEEALRTSEEKYRTLVENIQDGVFIIQDAKMQFVNEAFAKMIGCTVDEVIGKRFTQLVAPEDMDFVSDRYRRRQSGEDIPSQYEFRMLHKDGTSVHVNMNVGLVNYRDKVASMGTVKDITARKRSEKEKKRLEVQLHQAQKMEAIGTLAGGIAHDFNNLLMGIQGRTSLMLMDADACQRHFEHLKGIEDYVVSAADLTKQLLGFARGGRYEVRTTDLNELIKKQNQMFGRTRKEINIHGKYEQDLWAAEVDRNQIEQVLLNLYVNAWQAMPGGGELFTQTENTIIDEDYIKAYDVSPGKYVKISITDTGVGMDKATQQRVFDPFFTTKEMGRGTGLGLASVYGIIKNHLGFIDVYSEKGKGTTFNIYLPASDKKVVEQNKRHEEILRGTETILLVDDEEIVADVGEQILKTLGYSVFLARSGENAVQLYGENRDRIDMVILDMIMPGMSGGNTYDRLKEIDPCVKVLLSSGYSINSQATEIIERGCDGFIQKPFNLENLSKKIREIIDTDRK